ncbi:MAG TPA: hypothetical protein VII97_06810 [Anaerolineales bacterium]
MPDDLKKSQLRAVQYQHVDGTFELTFGGTFLLMAASLYLVSRLEHPDSSLISFAPLLVFLIGVFLIDNLVQRFRRRVTYPRTGYITYRKPQSLKRSTRLVIWIGVPLLTAALVDLLFLYRSKFPAQSQDSALPVMPVFSGLLFTGLWVIVGWKIALPRFYLIAAASLLISAGLFVSGVGTYLGMALLFSAMGALLCASGGVTLWKYLRSTRSPQDNQPEE